MAYVSQEFKKAVEPKIKALCKQYGVKGTLSVRHHMTLVLTIQKGKLDFMGDYANSTGYDAATYTDVNPYNDKHFTDKTMNDFINEAIQLLKTDRYFDHSDPMTDYFHVSHYIGIQIGKWDKPYILEK